MQRLGMLVLLPSLVASRSLMPLEALDPPNATSAGQLGMNDQSAFPGAGVAGAMRLLLLVPYAERIPMLMQQYSCLPWSIIMAVADVPSCQNACADFKPACTCTQLSWKQDSSNQQYTQFHHQLIANHADGSSDLLYSHADMWLSRHIYATLQGTKSMMGPTGSSCSTPGPGCSFQPSSWPFWADFSRGCCDGMHQGSDDAQPLLEFGACCTGWADLAFLPRDTQTMFASIARGPLAGVACHEGTIPTIMHAVAKAQRSVVHSLQCAGGALGGIGWGDITDDTRCAHPVDLRDGAGWEIGLGHENGHNHVEGGYCEGQALVLRPKPGFHGGYGDHEKQAKDVLKNLLPSASPLPSPSPSASPGPAEPWLQWDNPIFRDFDPERLASPLGSPPR